MASLSVTDAQDSQNTAQLLHDKEASVQHQQQPPHKLLSPQTALGSPEEDASSVAVHKFPVEKRLLLQMRFRQLYSRTPARLVTTPAKSLPVHSTAAGMVSPSHVGPAHDKPKEAGQTSVEHLRSLQLDNADAALRTPRHMMSPSKWLDKPLPLPWSEVPRFEDLRNQQDTASQQAGGIGNVLQHDIADPGVYSQWPESPPRHVVSHEPHPIPMHQLPQQLHGQQQPLPSYAWSTEQLTAIATAAATAAAAAVQSQPGQPPVTAHTRQQAPAITTAVSEPVVRHSLQAPLALQAFPSIKLADGAQTTLADQGAVAKQEQALGQGTAAVNAAQQPKVMQSVQVNKSQHGRGQPGAPKQADALQKLKHRKAVGRSSTAHLLKGQTVSPERQTAASGGTCLEQPAVPMGSDFQPVSQQLPQQQMVGRSVHTIASNMLHL